MVDKFKVVAPLLEVIPPELAHRLAIWALGAGLSFNQSDQNQADSTSLAIELWGHRFPNPLGLAAGFDKHAEAIAPLLRLGFGFVEVGSITPRPQPGNPRPRLFRLTADRAAINRMGFNSRGAARAATRLAAFRSPGFQTSGRSGLVGVNLGKNKESPSAAADYAAGARVLGGFADYLVINVSSPNTPGLHQLHASTDLEALIRAVRDALGPNGPALLVKISPDLAPEDLADVAALGLDMAIDGFIATNTTLSRPPNLRARHRDQAGGLSGRPVFEIATRTLGELYRLTGGKIPLIGVGGIASGADAYRKIRAGASLVQLYTALIFEGPALIGRIKRELAELLARDGYARLADAVGADHRAAGTP